MLGKERRRGAVDAGDLLEERDESGETDFVVRKKFIGMGPPKLHAHWEIGASLAFAYVEGWAS
jgi:hypothetical protein